MGGGVKILLDFHIINSDSILKFLLEPFFILFFNFAFIIFIFSQHHYFKTLDSSWMSNKFRIVPINSQNALKLVITDLTDVGRKVNFLIFFLAPVLIERKN